MLLVPEKFGDGHPHFHGILAFPPDDLHRLGETHLIEEYQKAWKATVPSGTLEIRPIYDPDGWIAYCSKESSLSLSDNATWSLADFVP
ncbi:hypothetical protein [Caulobacter radicis]|uniref:Replication protein n=1 Tax=Caulobacter radicis TaxID=2172650 RepID=A0A2T9IWF2_9CAUL|nr:hypothetical protein [Caulobacter radicis]PVM71276.1 hypothetical protein DDF65_23850 [Caulobacter radicis]